MQVLPLNVIGLPQHQGSLAIDTVHSMTTYYTMGACYTS